MSRMMTRGWTGSALSSSANARLSATRRTVMSKSPPPVPHAVVALSPTRTKSGSTRFIDFLPLFGI